MDQLKTRIGIIGTGGVGGYFGGLLADKYYNSDTVDIIFIVRPKTEKIIREKGLKLTTPEFEKVIFPIFVSSNPDEIGELDYVICTTKSYQLEESILPLKKCITPETIIIPVLNGVDSKGKIESWFPQNEVLFGCVYLVSRQIEPGVILKTGNMHSFHFGSSTAPIHKLSKLESILKEASIECYLTETIQKTIWQKYMFISSIASLTCYLNKSIGEIFENKEWTKMLTNLLQEVHSVAIANKIDISENIVEITLQQMKTLPYESTSSMHSDFQKGNLTEFESLTEYVSFLGQKLNVKTSTFDLILTTFKNRI